MNFPKRLLKSHLNNRRGQGLIEYLVLVALIAVVAIGAVKVVGLNLHTQYERINRALGAETQGTLTIRNSRDVGTQRDLSDFIENARDKK